MVAASTMTTGQSRAAGPFGRDPQSLPGKGFGGDLSQDCRTGRGLSPWFYCGRGAVFFPSARCTRR